MVISESVLNKRWREELEAKWKKDCENCMLIFNRACENCMLIEKKLIQPKWETRVNGFYVCPEAKPTFIIRFCGQC